MLGAAELGRAGLIPALAGTTQSVNRSRARHRAHPRAGGDDVPVGFSPGETEGSSPRWRGRRPTRGASHSHQGLIPALAGTTSTRTSMTSSARAHPRAGGDDCCVPPGAVLVLGSSPRWRGRLLVEERPSEWGGLIPALAGTTPRSGGSGSSERAHPRAGGDDAVVWGVGGAVRAHPRAGGDDLSTRGPATATWGSSPRWRGRPRPPPSEGAGRGLIPALAGTTSRASRVTEASRAHPRAGGDDTYWQG